MCSFKENFFFVRFAVLFFILAIFGYWGIDLNSEELYIAFTFFFLVILAFVIVRRAILFFFVKAVNAKYSRMLASLLLVVGALRINVQILDILSGYVPLFVLLVRKFMVYLVDFLTHDLPIFTNVYRVKFNFLQMMSYSSLQIFLSRLVRSKRSVTFFGKFFDIKL